MAPVTTLAHHSGSEYDRTTVEIEGTLVELVWQNPHVHFGVRTTKDGKPVVWDIEANSLSILRRSDANPDNLKLGDRIKVAGAPSRQTSNKMWASNILPVNGREVVLGPGIPPRWKTIAHGQKSTWTEGGTDAARKKRAAFNPLTDTVAPGCRPKGMPTIMEPPRAAAAKSLLGTSQGKWEGDTLVVTTAGISWSYFDPSGVPPGPSASIVERFTPTPDGTRLTLKMTVTAPDTFTQPIDLQRTWVWRKGETVKPYNCVDRKPV